LNASPLGAGALRTLFNEPRAALNCSAAGFG
jgi:hypothetical protein